MKWYFALSESSIDRADHDWRALVKVAVYSARRNTSLKPVLLYDGEESSFLDQLRGMGVNVIHHRVTFYNALVEIERERPGYLSIASGTFMRVDIPLIETEDDFILYSDCDVVFLKDLELSSIRPNYFAAAPQSSKQDYEKDMNAGVMVVNIQAMRAVRPWFVDFIIANLRSGWPGFDQENYRRFFRGRWDNLPLEFNWKPYWGVSTDAALLHWHGPKPALVQKLVRDPNLATVEIWKLLFERNSEGYQYFLHAWKELEKVAQPEVHGYMDVLSSQGATGWAAYRYIRDVPVVFSVWIDGIKVSDVSCDAPRADVKALHGVHASGFHFSIPERYVDGNQHKLELKDKDGALIQLKSGKVLHESYRLEFVPALDESDSKGLNNALRF